MADFAFTAVSLVFAFYMIVLLLTSLVLVLIGWSSVNRYVAMRPLRDYDYVDGSDLSLPVSVIVPAYNEAKTVIHSVHSLLGTGYTRLEIIVVNDGSSDDTLATLTEAFRLTPTERVPRSGLTTSPIRATYESLDDARIIVVDKVQGGKADALNAGINVSTFPLVCAVDADTLLDQGAIGRLVWEFQADPSTVATGGIVRISNGSLAEGGLITSVQMPSRFLTQVQILEYLRAFFGGRIAWSRLNCLIVISGAFGLFRRQALIDIGGYDPNTVTEDAELIVRLHQHARDTGAPCRITFFPDPVCWTEAPATMSQLARQRDRWQRGLGQTLLDSRSMLFRRRYGRIGWFALPYYWVFEFLEPLITAVGVVVSIFGLAFGFLSPTFFTVVLLLVLAYGFVINMFALMIEERAYRRYPSWRDLRILIWVSIAENFGFRQWQTIIRLRAMFRVRSAGTRWGEMHRVGFSPTPLGTGEID